MDRRSFLKAFGATLAGCSTASVAKAAIPSMPNASRRSAEFHVPSIKVIGIGRTGIDLMQSIPRGPDALVSYVQVDYLSIRFNGRITRGIEPPDMEWTPFSTLKFYKRPPELILSSHDRRLDLSDNLTGNVTFKKGRVLYCGISTISNDWKVWNEKNLKKMEADIRYDLEFDAYNVKIERVTSAVCPVTKKKDIPCSTEFLWKLTISVAT